MRIKQLFANLGMILALGALFLSVPTFATGEEEPDSPNQSENTDDADETEDGTDDTENNSSDNSSIGGGLNADGNNQPAPSEPSQPDAPSVSKPLPQPEDLDTEGPQSTPTTKPTLPTVTLKPQVQPSKPNITATPVAPTPETVDDEVTSTVPAIPAAPNDNIAPTDIETPLTGIVEDQSTPVNPLAVVLLILAGITIITAGIVSTLLSKVAQRNQSAI